MIDAEQVTEILKFLFWGLRNQVQLSRLSSSDLEVLNNPNDSLGLVELVPLQTFEGTENATLRICWEGRRLKKLRSESSNCGRHHLSVNNVSG